MSFASHISPARRRLLAAGVALAAGFAGFAGVAGSAFAQGGYPTADHMIVPFSAAAPPTSWPASSACN